MERHIGLHIIITFFFFFFFSNICDYIKEGPVLLLRFPSLSLSPLIGPLKHGVCVCCFVLFVLSGCYVVLLCVKKKKNVANKSILYKYLYFRRLKCLAKLMNAHGRHIQPEFQKCWDVFKI